MKTKVSKIKVLIMDVDGILTDGRIIIDSQGKEIKVFDVKDGLAIVRSKQVGLKTAIISARSAEAVRVRAEDLKIDKVYQDANPKLEAYEKLLKEFGVSDAEVCFMGDDLPDLPVLRRAGFAVTVPDAVPEAKKICDYVTKKEGGRGAVREVIELILKTQGKWKKLIP